jgi:hypothetical protein
MDGGANICEGLIGYSISMSYKLNFLSRHAMADAWANRIKESHEKGIFMLHYADNTAVRVAHNGSPSSVKRPSEI